MMNITKENIDELNAVIKAKVGPDDYKERVESALKQHQKKVNMPGFRPGKVPVGMVKKMYGKAIMVDEINRLLNDSLHNYIKENKLEVLGSPLPKDDLQFDWDNQTEFEFQYDLGLAPQFKVEVSSKNKFTRYSVRIDEPLVDKWVNDLCRRYGKWNSPETSGEMDYLFGDFVQLDTAGNIQDGGIFKKGTTIILEKIKDANAKKQLIGLKKDDAVTVDMKAIAKDTAEIATMLGVDATAAAGVSSPFRFTVSSIGHMAPADVNQELFDKVYGPGTITTAEEFRNKVRAEMENMFSADSDQKLKNDIRKSMMENIKISLPDEFLKRWLVAANEKPVTIEQVNAEYDTYAKSLRWELITNKLIKDNNIKVTGEEV